VIVKEWCETQTDMVSPLPHRWDMHNVKDEYGKVIGRERVYLYERGKGWLYSEFIKPVEEGGCFIATDEFGNVKMKRTTFESLLPTNLRVMNKTHKQMCGCKEHQNMDYKHAALIDWRNDKMENYERLLEFDYPPGHSHRRFTLSSMTNFKNYCYAEDGKPIWPTCDEAVAAMTCQPIGEHSWQVKYSCVLGLCEDCPKLPTCIQERSQNSQEESNIISYKEVCVEYSCGAHGFVGYKKLACSRCIHERIPAKKRPKVKASEQVNIKSCTIGDFMKNVYPKQLRNYSQHRFLCNVLGKQGCLGQKEDSALDWPGNVLIHRDYTTKLPMEFNNAPMGVGMGGTPTVGMEGMVVKFKDNGSSRLHWVGFVSDEKQQDARTSFRNTNRIILRMDKLDDGYLQPDMDQVLHIVSDGCTAQYKCANTLQTYIWLSHWFEIAIDVMVTAPYHGKSLVDALAGVDKSLLSQKLVKGFDSATRGADGKIISQAEVCVAVLSDETRRYGSCTDTKHKKHAGEARVDERYYELANQLIPLQECAFRVDPKQWGKGTKNKIKEMFHFYYHPDMPENTCAVRMIPCHCPGEGGCKDQLTLPWDLGKTARDQNRFKPAPNCELKPLLGDLNNWKFITTELVQMESDKAKKQVNVLLQMKLDQLVDTTRDNIKLLHFGAISCGDAEEFWLVEWNSHPFQLQAPTQVEGCPTPQPAGTWVCKGTFYNRVNMAKGWYEKQRRAQPLLFRLSQVIRADVEVERYHPRNNAPPPAANRAYDKPNAKAFLRYVPINIRNLMLRDERRLSKLGLYYMNGERHEDAVEQEPQTESDEDEDDEDGVDEDVDKDLEEEVDEASNDDSEEESEPEE
jgi:hypothetical protein